MTEKYRQRSGFAVPGFDCLCMRGEAGDFLTRVRVDDEVAKSVDVQPYTLNHYAALRDFDEEVAGVDRDAFLRVWLSQPFVKAACAFRGGRMVGFGCLCPNRTGMKIGPLYADSQAIALLIATHLLSNFPWSTNKEIAFSVPGANHPFIQALTDSGIPLTLTLNRSYTKNVLANIRYDKIFSYTASYSQPE